MFVRKLLLWLDNKFETTLIAWIMAAMLLVSTVQVFTRYFLSYSFSWGEQAVRLGFVWITLLGVSLAAKKGMHLKVEAAITFLPRRVAGVIQMLSDVFTIAFSLLLSWWILKFTIVQFQVGQVYAAIPWLPVGVMYVAGVLGLFGLAVRTFEARFWPRIRQLAKR